jgi:DNA-binding LacI/PurR family transcriptional regulator
MKKVVVNRTIVAKKAGVSQSTVSRVLTDHPGIPGSTKLRVRKIIDKLGYVPCSLARNLYQKRSYRVGVIVPYSKTDKRHLVPHEYFSKLLLGIILAAKEKKYTVDIIPDDGLSAAELQHMIQSHTVDGLVFMVSRIGDARFAKLHAAGIPFVIAYNADKTKPYIYVDCDSSTGLSQAFDHLTLMKIKRIGFLSGGTEYTNSIERKKLVNSLASKHGMVVTTTVEGNFSRLSGYNAATEFIKKPMPQVILCANDRMAAGLLEGLKKKNVAVPDDVGIIGFDNQEVSVLVQPHLATIENPFFEIGHEVSHKLIDMIYGHEVKSELVKSSFVIRESI